MTEKTPKGGTRPPLHRDPQEADRPVPRRTWRHARYGDPAAPARPGGPKDGTFSEKDDAAASGDERQHQH